MTDKLNRFEQLAKPFTEQKCRDESIIDTLMDLANYAILTAIYFKNNCIFIWQYQNKSYICKRNNN